jgi:malonyl-CoA O-methyltransferase
MTLLVASEVDAQRAARSFSAAAASYDRAAQLQSETRAQLLCALESRVTAPQRLLDLGCGTGQGAAALQRRYPAAAVLALDRAPGMVRSTRAAGIGGALISDAQALPLAAQCCDAVLSNLMLQWCPQPQRVLAECRRVLRPGGWLLLSIPGPATLHELRSAWRAIDDDEHVHRFAPLSALAGWAQAAGLQADSLQSVALRYRYADVFALMQSLRDIGARNASAGRRRGLLAASALRRLATAYPSAADGAGVSATWEILYAVLRRPA